MNIYITDSNKAKLQVLKRHGVSMSSVVNTLLENFFASPESDVNALERDRITRKSKIAAAILGEAVSAAPDALRAVGGSLVRPMNDGDNVARDTSNRMDIPEPTITPPEDVA